MLKMAQLVKKRKKDVADKAQADRGVAKQIGGTDCGFNRREVTFT